ncbi:hypothetical protein AB4156_43415, partial [Cupriavidus sp. 2MCAB6]|uniref:hypothetical protein n=1 Tax=Cupriavidus sp. 2MCAB6 TaxID=3232981 RepID=UPI003F8EB483
MPPSGRALAARLRKRHRRSREVATQRLCIGLEVDLQRIAGGFEIGSPLFFAMRGDLGALVVRRRQRDDTSK